MKTTIAEVIDTVERIETTIDSLMKYTNENHDVYFEEILEGAVSLLEKYRTMILDTKVDI